MSWYAKQKKILWGFEMGASGVADFCLTIWAIEAQVISDVDIWVYKANINISSNLLVRKIARICTFL